MPLPTRAHLPTLLLTLASLTACQAPGGPAAGRGTPRPDAPSALEAENPLRPLPTPPLGSPADFAAVPWVTPAKVRLGRWLFYDGRLSADGTVSCATCHEPESAFSEKEPHSTGIRGQQGKRKAPPILNPAWPVYPVFFWDGRATTLVEQAKGPIQNPIEMGNTAEAVVATLSRVEGYRRYFAEAFGDPRVDFDRVAEAIAAYEATRLSGNSRADRFDAGDLTALDERARHGRELFFGRAACSQCHLGPNFSDAKFYNLGVGYVAPKGDLVGSGFEDAGRYAISHAAADLGAFKTPTLRELTRRAPYMHDGSVATLRETVVLYFRAGVDNPWRSERLDQARFAPFEVDDLVAFLEALEGEGYADTAPRRFPE
jgi:cytochrome c peroxidase